MARVAAVIALGLVVASDGVRVGRDGTVTLGHAQAQAQPAPPRPPARPEPGAKPAEPSGPAPAPPQAAPAAQPAPGEWESFPTMLLERIYRGPLRDTIIQRWRDPIDGTVCFVYMPISAPLLPAPAQTYVQYGANQIGSVSCVHPTEVIQLLQQPAAPTPPPQPQRR